MFNITYIYKFIFILDLYILDSNVNGLNYKPNLNSSQNGKIYEDNSF